MTGMLGIVFKLRRSEDLPIVQLSAWPQYSWHQGERIAKAKRTENGFIPYVQEYNLGKAIAMMGACMTCKKCGKLTTWRITSTETEVFAFCSAHDPDPNGPMSPRWNREGEGL